MRIIRSIAAWFTGILFLVGLFPPSFIIWLVALPFDPGRKVIHTILVWQSSLIMRIMPVWKVAITGREKFSKEQVYVIISNHQSLLDILLINSLRFRFKWISKIENTKVPFLGWYLRMAGYITINRGNEESKAEMLARSYQVLKSGTSIMIFPEGTRSTDSNLGFFKRGAFQLAIETNTPVLPVLIDGTGGVLPKNSIWFRGKNNLVLKVLDPVYPANFGTNNPDELSLVFRNILAVELLKLRKGNGTLT